jgi:hypothetical protein
MRGWYFVICAAACGGSPASSDAQPAGSDAAADGENPDAPCGQAVERDGPYTRFTVANDDIGTGGFIDPSVEYSVAASGGLMSYTTIPDASHVHIALAASVDAGASWVFQGEVSQARAVTIDTTDMSVCGSTTCSGTLVDESSSLVVDPFEPDASRRLKVFMHEYFYGSDMNFQLGYMAMYTAATPSGPWTETKLFGWNSSSSLTSTGVAYNVSTDPRLPELHDCFIVAEPGAYGRSPGTIDLALGCVVIAGSAATIDIRLLRSTDHGVTWTYVNKLLSASDAGTLGAKHNQINGPDLFYARGKVHLVVSPVGDVVSPGGTFNGYRGCVVVPIADLDAGTVERCGGVPVIETAYRGQPGEFVGACSAADGATAAGMMIPVPQFTQTPVFQVFAAQQPLP